jgi:hypothetical protein
MSKLGAAFLAAVVLAAAPVSTAPVSAAEVPHRIARDAAWGCRDKSDLLDLLFLGLSTSFDTKLAIALAEGRCIYFNSGEDVVVVEPGEKGLIQVQRTGAAPATYWTPSRNIR